MISRLKKGSVQGNPKIPRQQGGNSVQPGRDAMVQEEPIIRSEPHSRMQIQTQMANDPWQTHSCGLTDKELLRQTKHSKKTSIFERSAPALAGTAERGWALETKQLPLPTSLFAPKGQIYGTASSQTSEGHEKHTATCEHTLLQINSAKSCKQL